MVENKRIVWMEKYDPVSGEWVTDIRSSDIYHLASTGGTTPSSSGEFVIASGTVSSSEEVYVTSVHISATSDTAFAVVVGSSTKLPIYVDASVNPNVTINGGKDEPILKIDAGSTVKLVVANATTSGTYSAFLSGIKVPIVSKINL